MKYLAAGKRVDLKGDWGQTALWRAAAANQLSCVRLLLQSGADPNVPDWREGNNALHIASYLGYLEIVRCLVVEGGADLTQENLDGRTAYWLARKPIRPVLTPNKHAVAKLLDEAGGGSVARGLPLLLGSSTPSSLQTSVPRAVEECALPPPVCFSVPIAHLPVVGATLLNKDRVPTFTTTVEAEAETGQGGRDEARGGDPLRSAYGGTLGASSFAANREADREEGPAEAPGDDWTQQMQLVAQVQHDLAPPTEEVLDAFAEDREASLPALQCQLEPPAGASCALAHGLRMPRLLHMAASPIRAKCRRRGALEVHSARKPLRPGWQFGQLAGPPPAAPGTAIVFCPVGTVPGEALLLQHTDGQLSEVLVPWETSQGEPFAVLLDERESPKAHSCAASMPESRLATCVGDAPTFFQLAPLAHIDRLAAFLASQPHLVDAFKPATLRACAVALVARGFETAESLAALTADDLEGLPLQFQLWALSHHDIANSSSAPCWACSSSSEPSASACSSLCI